MYDDILVPTDGTAVAEQALEAVMPIATAAGATIHVLHVVDLSPVSPSQRSLASEALGDQATTHTEGLAASAGDGEVQVETAVVETTEPVHEAIVEYATGHGIDLIAMGTRAPTGLERLTVGSVTRRTLRTATQPVLTVTPMASVGGLEAVLHPTDGSAAAEAGADVALGLCSMTEAGLHVINVVDESGPWSTLETSDLLVAFEAMGREAVDVVIERAEDAGLSSVQASVLEGDPADVIVEYADERDVDAIVLGTHGRRGLDRVLLGSVAEAVVARAPVPVIVARSTDDAA